MIIHSIIPMETIFPSDQEEASQEGRIIELNNIKVEARLVEGDIYEIQRIYSTNARDYLEPGLQPGTRIRLNYEVDSFFP